MDIIYETERLFLKVFNQNDLEEAKRFWGDKEVMDQSGGITPHEILPKVLEGYERCHQVKGLSVYAVAEKSTGKVIGAAGFNVSDSVERIELLYHFSKPFWGKGFATEAARACMEIARQNSDCKIIYASANPLNLASVKILELLGFQSIEMRWFEDTNQKEPYYEYKVRPYRIV